MTRMMEMHFSSNPLSRGRRALCLPSGFLARRAAREKTREAKRWRENNKIALCSSRPLNRTIAIIFTRQSRFSERLSRQAGEQLIQMSPWTFQLNAIDHLTWINNSVTSERALSSSLFVVSPKTFSLSYANTGPAQVNRSERVRGRHTTTPRPLKFIIYEPSKSLKFSLFLSGPPLTERASNETKTKTRNALFVCKSFQATSSTANIKALVENVSRFLFYGIKSRFVFSRPVPVGGRFPWLRLQRPVIWMWIALNRSSMLCWTGHETTCNSRAIAASTKKFRNSFNDDLLLLAISVASRPH